MVVAGRAVFVIAAMRIVRCARRVRIILAALFGRVRALGEKNHIGSEAAGV